MNVPDAPKFAWLGLDLFGPKDKCLMFRVPIRGGNIPTFDEIENEPLRGAETVIMHCGGLATLSGTNICCPFCGVTTSFFSGVQTLGQLWHNTGMQWKPV